ncbi:MAG: hypothetical protein FWD57_17095 [Polyangiaceae bacterium]|nr:hypothetical protein [Polyangiaceae bacterium]
MNRQDLVPLSEVTGHAPARVPVRAAFNITEEAAEQATEEATGDVTEIAAQDPNTTHFL